MTLAFAPRISRRSIGERVRAALAAVWAWVEETVSRLTGGLRRAAVLGNMVPADIILASPRTLTLSPGALLYRLLLRSHYVHAMLYVGHGKMVHTTTRHGVVVSPVPRRLYKRNRYTILRARGLGPEQRERVVAYALASVGTELDQAGLVTNVPARLLGLPRPLVRFEENRLWCSKLIYQAYLAAGEELVPPEDAETVTSEDLSESPVLVPVL